MRHILLQLDQGWKTYVEPRFEKVAVNDTINVEPHQLDGLSFPMTLVYLVKKMKLWHNE